MNDIKIEYKGWIRGDVPDNTSLLVAGVLDDMGAYGVSIMREKLADTRASGRLYDSVMWQTNRNSSSISGQYSEADQLPVLTEENTVEIGSAAPHAPYRETYSGMHVTDDGSAEFIKSLKEWVRKVLGRDPDDGDIGKAVFEEILKEIRDKNTPGTPFVEPSITAIENYALQKLKAVQIRNIEIQNKEGGV